MGGGGGGATIRQAGRREMEASGWAEGGRKSGMRWGREVVGGGDTAGVSGWGVFRPIINRHAIARRMRRRLSDGLLDGAYSRSEGASNRRHTAFLCSSERLGNLGAGLLRRRGSRRYRRWQGTRDVRHSKGSGSTSPTGGSRSRLVSSFVSRHVSAAPESTGP